MEKEPQYYNKKGDEISQEKQDKPQEENLPADFTLEELKPSRHFGGSSMLYFLGDRFVVKEKLSEIAKEVCKEGAINRRHLLAVSIREKQVQESEKTETIKK